MNARRAEPITLRYFQHLAALYTEIFLDWYFHRRAQMLRSLNGFVAKRNAKKLAGEPQDATFSGTGPEEAGLLDGDRQRQDAHHAPQLSAVPALQSASSGLDNILLITPNEGLSDQHLAELAASGIPARRFDLNESGLGLAAKNTVRVIEITKLVEEKRGGGVSVPVEAFEGNNLIFVDEGHKGSGGEAWRKIPRCAGRDRLHLRVQRHLRAGPDRGAQRSS